MSESSTLDRVLRGRQDRRVRAVWRIVAVALTFAVVFFPAVAVVEQIPFPDVVRNAPIVIPVAVATVPTVAVSKRLEGRSVGEQGLSLDRQWWMDFAGGTVLGVAAQGLVIALWIRFGTTTVVETFSTGVLSGTAVVIAVAGATIGYLGVGFWEELVFRGILVRNGVDGLVARGFSSSTAAVGTVVAGGVLFGLPHAFVPAPGASTTFAALQAVTSVVYFTTAYVLTESLALPIGLHFSMDYATVIVFTSAESGAPALVRVDRTLAAEPGVIGGIVVGTTALTLAIVAWVRLTRGAVSIEGLFTRADRAFGSTTDSDTELETPSSENVD